MTISAGARFDDRIAIVTGAGRGLGREHALLLGARRATVIVDDVWVRRAQRPAEEVAASRGACRRSGSRRPAAHGRRPVRTDPVHVVGERPRRSEHAPRLDGQSRPLGLTGALAVEGLAHGLAVNALAPIGVTRSAALNPNEDTRRWMEERFPPSLCAPAALWLVHDDVPCSGGLVSAGAGRVARIATVGVRRFDAGPHLTLEIVCDRLGRGRVDAGQPGRDSGGDDLGFYRRPAARRS